MKKYIRIFKRWFRSLPPILVLILVLISLPLSLLFVQGGIKFLSRAAVTADIYFNPSSATLPPDQTMRIMVDAKTNNVGFVAIKTNPFDTSKIRLTSEITTTSLLSNVVSKTTMAEANNTGVITIVLALCHPDVNCGPPPPSPATDVFELANFQITSISSLPNDSTSISINNSATQLVDAVEVDASGWPVALSFNSQPVSLTLNAGPSPTPGADIITNLDVKDSNNSADWSVQNNLAIGDTVYGDRIFTFTSIPSAYRGLQWIRTANDSKNFAGNPTATFTAASDGTVYLAHDQRYQSTRPWWITTDWTSTGDNLQTDETGNIRTFNIFSRHYNANQTVNLGFNRDPLDSTVGSMYIVMAKPDVVSPSPTPTNTPTPTGVPPTATPTPSCTPPPGDGDFNCRVNGLDYVIWLNGYGTQLPGIGPADGDYFDDDEVNGVDYVVWLNNYTG